MFKIVCISPAHGRQVQTLTTFPASHGEAIRAFSDYSEDKQSIVLIYKDGILIRDNRKDFRKVG